MSREAGKRHANGAMNCVECANPFFPATREGLCFGCKENPRSQQLAARNDDLEAALAQARRFKPVPIGPSSPIGEPKDISVDRWGARRKGLPKQWTGANCLRASIASLLGVDVARVPNPTASYEARDDWHQHYSERLAQQVGHRLEFLPVHMCPPKNAGQVWIAGIHEFGDRDGHAVVARGPHVLHDPAGIYQGRLPLDRLTDGMLVVPTRRVMPVLSPLGSGYTVVPA